MWNYEEYGDDVAIITDEGDCFSFMDITEWQKEIGKVLKTQAVALICSRNEVGCLLNYLACMKKGIIPLLIPDEIDEDKLKFYMERYVPFYLICPIKKHVNSDWLSVLQVGKYIIYQRKNCYRNVEIHEDLALLLPTSGSTGSPKCVRLSKENLRSNTQAICDYLPIDQNSRYITSLPMCYTYGLSNIHIHLELGGKVILTEKSVLDKDFWTLFDRYEVNSFAGVPFTYEVIKKLKLFENMNRTLKLMTQAGGHLDENIQRYFIALAKEKEIKFYVMYGQTEATARISYLPPKMLESRLGSVGIPISGGALYVEKGEIVYTGANVSMGYAYDVNDLKKGDENGGILHTGDLGYFENGYLYLTGRMSREVKLNGKRFNLDQVEKDLREHYTSGFHCAFIEGKLLVYITDTKLDPLIITRWICSRWQISRREVDIFTVNQIPFKSNGKIDYEALRKKENFKRKEE